MDTIFYEQTFGVEMEMTGISRENASRVIANYFGTSNAYEGGGYRIWTARSRDGRIWKAMSDGSIRTTGGPETACEVVTPILRYADMDDLQNIVRALRSAGAVVNDSCGIHIHIGGNLHNAYSVTRLCNLMLKRQNLIYAALENEYRSRWCQKLNKNLVAEMKKNMVSKESLKPVWYGSRNEGGDDYCAHDDSWTSQHYNSTRYHGINLHAWYTKGTIEFRLFNATLHAGKIKAYVQFCLALSTYALRRFDNGENARFENTDNLSPEGKYKAMMNFLERRLLLTGKEFATCRKHMTDALARSAGIAA